MQNLKKMRILFDLDNTIYDLLGGVEKTFKGYHRKDQKTYNLVESKHINKEDLYSLFRSTTFFRELKPYEHVIKTIKNLNIEGHTIHFYSQCFNEEVLQEKKKCLQRDFDFCWRG